MIDIGLVLEGGGMRGAYTAGVLDYFLDEGLAFSRTYAVSAGAGHACSYISKQRGRAINVVLTLLHDWRYGSFRSFLCSGDYFDRHFVYENVPRTLLPFDYDTFRHNPQKLFATVTNVQTGLAEYRALDDLETDIDWLCASASLPLLSKLVTIDGSPYLDGGIADSIPLARSIKDGQKKNIVILTRPKDYRKSPSNSVAMRLRYRKYPNFIHAAASRHQVYNDSLDLTDAESRAGHALILRPEDEIKIGRLEKNSEKLRRLYDAGYQDAKSCVKANPGFF